MHRETILASVVTVASYNVTANSVIGRSDVLVGFTANPNHRGTMNIVQNCLFTILACSWSILHMNLPGPNDGRWTKLFRKVKWTLITILCPEFILAHAIVERSMAYETMAKMQKLGGENSHSVLHGWRIGSGETFLQGFLRKTGLIYVFECICRTPSRATTSNQTQYGTEATGSQEINLQNPNPGASVAGLHAYLLSGTESAGHEDIEDDTRVEVRETGADGGRVENHSSSDELIGPRSGPKYPDSEPEFVLTWTLSHAFYANMGGIRMFMRPVGPQVPTVTLDEVSTYVTADMLACFCFPAEFFNPLKKLRISEKDINDKSKTDAFTKLIAVMQIIWLVFSVCARFVRDISSSQLEITTLAFAVLAVFTYAAYLHKPQNVDEPTTIVVPIDPLGDPDVPKIIKRRFDHLRPESFFIYIFSPFSIRDYRTDTAKHDPRIRERIPNDNMDRRNSTLNSMSFWMAVATMVFGGLHCLAWNFEFPSQLEKVTWRVSSLVTACTPAILLGVNSLLVSFATRRYEKIVFGKKQLERRRLYESVTVRHTQLYRIFPIIGGIIYAISRIVTIVIAFSSLRSMPKDVYLTTWAKYLPNVQ